MMGLGGCISFQTWIFLVAMLDFQGCIHLNVYPRTFTVKKVRKAYHLRVNGGVAGRGQHLVARICLLNFIRNFHSPRISGTVPKMEVLDLIRVWGFPYIRSIHTAYIGEYVNFGYLWLLTNKSSWLHPEYHGIPASIHEQHTGGGILVASNCSAVGLDIIFQIWSWHP